MDDLIDEISRRHAAEMVRADSLIRDWQTIAFRYKSALELIAAPKRSDGTYNRSREACELVAREALQLRGTSLEKEKT